MLGLMLEFDNEFPAIKGMKIEIHSSTADGSFYQPAYDTMRIEFMAAIMLPTESEVD